MTTKHTPATWILKTRKWTNHDIDSVVESESGEQIAYFPNLKDKSNAKLIATAPELLEALQLIFKHYDRNNGESPHHCHLHKAHWDIDDAVCEVCADWEKARAAIAKATQ